MYNVSEPSSREEILQQLKQLNAASTDYWNSFSTESFLASIGDAWSPADNVRHLNKSIRPINKALRLPRPALALLFGRTKEPARSYQQIITTYQGILAAGATAGRFAPAPESKPANPAAWRAALMAEQQTIMADLEQAVLRWDEAAL